MCVPLPRGQGDASTAFHILMPRMENPEKRDLIKEWEQDEEN